MSRLKKDRSLFLRTLALSFLFFGSLMAETTPRGRPYIEISGRTLTTSDLQKLLPDDYDELKEHSGDELDLLRKLSELYLFSLEAVEKNQSRDEYIRAIRRAAVEPTEAEIRKQYDSLKEERPETIGTYTESRDQVLDYLRRVAAYNAISAELSRLKEKFHFRLSRNLPPLVINTQGDPFRGVENGNIVVIEFSDFECPYCRRAQAVSAELRKKYSGRIRWTVKDFPLSFHPHALGAHIAANCVLAQSTPKYWQFFDSLFGSRNLASGITPEGLENLARRLRIDMSRFQACLKNPAILKEIEGDMIEANDLGIQGTPTFIVNGKMIQGARPIEVFEEAIRSSD